MASPAAAIATQDSTDSARSATVRPIRTAERAIGRDRNRSTRPLPRSSATPTAVVAAPITIIWVKIPAMMNSRYPPPGTWIALPNR